MRRIGPPLLALACGCAGSASRNLAPTEARGVPPQLRPTKSAPPTDRQAQTQPEGELITLEQAIGQAWDGSIEVLRAEAQMAVVRERQRIEAREQLPTLDLRGGAGYLTGRTMGNFGRVDDASFWRFDPSVALVYRLNPGAQSKRNTAAKRDRDAAELDRADARRRASMSVAFAYHDVSVAQSAVEVAGQLEQDAQRFLDIARARAEAEIASGADVALAEAELANARRAKIESRGQWQATSATLATLLRRDPAALLAAPAPTPLTLVRLDEAAQVRDEAQRSRPDVQAAEARVSAAKSRHKAARYEIFVPDIALEVRERFIGSGVSNFGPGTIALGFIGWTFSLADIARAKSARAQRQAAELEVTAARERAAGEVYETLARARAAQGAIVAAREAVEANERHHRIQLARFEAGSALGLEVINAQNAVARSRLELMSAVVRYNTTQLEVLAAMGRLDPKAFAAPADR